MLDDHIIFENESVKIALSKLDKLASDAILFVANKDRKLIGSLPDGDLIRGFIKDLGLNEFKRTLFQYLFRFFRLTGTHQQGRCHGGDKD